MDINLEINMKDHRSIINGFIDQLESLRKFTPHPQLLEDDIEGYRLLLNESSAFLKEFLVFKRENRVLNGKLYSNKELYEKLKSLWGKK